MMRKSFLGLVFFSMLISVSGCCGQRLDPSGYMRSQDMVWEEMPLQWNEAAFTGNGHVGQMVYVDTTDNSVTFWLGRTDVTDHRGAPDRKTSMGVKGRSKFADFTRLDVGQFKIFLADKILSGQVAMGDFCYESGYYEDAVYWLTQSARQENPHAANGIGRCFYHGYGVRTSPRKAFNWFRHSA